MRKIKKQNKEINQEINQHQIFDNAFLSGCVWHKRLLIPLINEIFQKNIPLDAEIENAANEQYKPGTKADGKNTLIKRITDALIRVSNQKYHFECESKGKGEILLRIADYDMQISLHDAKYDNYSVKMELPETAVVFLRNHRKIPPKGTISYYKGNQSLTHSIQFFEVGKHSLEYLIEKNLYLLLPFYLVRYENAIKNTPKKYDYIEQEAQRVYQALEQAYDSDEITEIEYTNILLLCKDVVEVLSRKTDIQERLVDIMGNEILLTAEERGEVRGKKIGKAIGAFDMALENIKNAMESFTLSFDEVCDKLKIKDREQYRNYI